MHGHHNDPHPNPEQQAQDVLPRGRVQVNGAAGGPVSDGGKGGGGKSPPGNGKAPPPGNGAAAARSLPERVAALENEHKHLATKADLERGLRATERRMTKEINDSETRLRKEAQENKEQLQKEMRQLPVVILGGVAALMAIAGSLAGFFALLLG